MTAYHCLVADPPWPERGGGKSKRGADRHYKLMNAHQILVTMRTADSWQPADTAHLWMWVTDNYLTQGLWLMGKLGFRYVRTMVWIKAKHHDACAPGEIALQIGLGQYLRGAHELCLFGVRGKAMVPDPPNRPPSVIVARRTVHSKKPDEAFKVFETVSPGPRLEMFARAARPGWDSWGAEAPTLFSEAM